MTKNNWGEQFATPIARRLKQQIATQTGLTASAGVAPNKFLAKIASGWRKPDGLTVVPHQKLEAFLNKLPVTALWGVGPVTAKRLQGIGIQKLVDLRVTDDAVLKQLLGKQAAILKRLCYGEDDRPVTPFRKVKSSSSERTYPEDLIDLDIIRAELDRMARHAGSWLHAHNLFARTVTLKIRYSDFTTITRGKTTTPPTRDPELLTTHVIKLVKKTDAGTRPVRLLGVRVSNLTNSDQDRPAGQPRVPLLWDIQA